MPGLANLTRTAARQAAHDLDSLPDEHWSARGFCARPDVNPDDWFTDPKPTWSTVGQAIHACKLHCPVRRECLREFGPLGLRSTVVGGVYHNDQGKPSDYQPSAASCRHCRPGGAR